MSKINYEVSEENLSQFQKILGESNPLERSVVNNVSYNSCYVIRNRTCKNFLPIQINHIKDSRDEIGEGDVVFIAPGYKNKKSYIEQCIKHVDATITNNIKKANVFLLNERIIHERYSSVNFGQQTHLYSENLNDDTISKRFSYCNKSDIYISALFIDMCVLYSKGNITIVNENSLKGVDVLDLSVDKFDMYKEMYKNDRDIFLNLLCSSRYHVKDYYKLFKLIKTLGIPDYLLTSDKLRNNFKEKYNFIFYCYTESVFLLTMYNKNLLTKTMLDEICLEHDVLNKAKTNISNSIFTVDQISFNKEFLNKIKENEDRLINGHD